MARLNDPVVPAESIDALKRRFIRQNREIARVNSTQSLRIRNLESEISRLLAENISLREQIINLSHESERLRSAQTLANGVVELKQRLNDKIQELGGLVEELGGLPAKAERSSPRRRKSGLVDQKRSPNQKNWRNSATIGEVPSGQQEGRLPIIVEDKYYPRKTLDTDELRQLIPNNGDVSESPDLGPPPVAHFEETDPIKFDTRAGPIDDTREDEQVDEDVPLPPHLERRKKRRDSSLLKDLPTDPPTQEPLPAGKAVDVPSLKSGAKRKLSARDDDNAESASIQPDDFKFNRAAGNGNGAMPKSKGTSAQSRFLKADAADKGKLNTGKETSTRRALEPKSTNSPSKISRNATVADKIAALKEDVAKQAKLREQRKDKKPSVNSVRPILQDATEDIVIQSEPDVEPKDLPPKTPAGLELFSPTSTEPSVSREAQPAPEMMTTTSVEDVLVQTSRPSRRPRGAVSYAEPSLREKMRRPTKELVAAVADTAFQRASSVKMDDAERRSESREPEVNGVEKPSMRVITVKREDRPDSALWKTLPQAQVLEAGDEPPSPLGNKSSGQNHELPPSVLTDRRRRTSAVDNEGNFSKSRNSGAAISALVAGGQKAKTKESGVHQGIDSNGIDSQGDLGKALDKLSIFDGPISSPHSDDSAATAAKASEKSSSSTARHSRRHSTHPPGSKQPSQEPMASDDERQKPNHHRSMSEKTTSGSVHRDKPRKEIANDLKSAKSTASIDADGSNEGGTRADRAASRRRSMML